MLGTKFKFSTAFQPYLDRQTDIIHESILSSSVSHKHVESHHKLHKEVMDKTIQNNIHYKIWIGNKKLFKTFNVGHILHACSTDLF